MNRENRAVVFSAACAILTAVGITQAGAFEFIPLGDLPGGSFSSTATDISDDGKIVVGRSSSPNGAEAFRWTLDTGIIGLGDLDGGIFGSGANAISADGSTIVGFGTTAAGPPFNAPTQAFRWTEQEGMVSLFGSGDTFEGFVEAFGVSGDGSVVIGRSNRGGFSEGGGAGLQRYAGPRILGLRRFLSRPMEFGNELGLLMYQMMDQP